jgi:predicted GIY-YIG superfamily endonuclease
MKYIGNIEKLRNTVFVRNNKPKLRISSKFRKMIEHILIKYQDRKINTQQLMVEYNITESKAKYVISELKKLKQSQKSELIKVEESNNEKFMESYEKLCHIKQKYEEEIRIHGEQTRIQEGFVYIMKNPSWNGWIKAGMTIDYQSRLRTYNVNDPHEKFNFLCLKWVENRRDAEIELLSELNKVSDIRNGEWFCISDEEASKIFYD